MLCVVMAGCAHCLRTGKATVGGKDAGVYHAKATYAGQWSDRTQAESQRDAQKFHGPFETRPVAFSLGRLPAHAWVKVRFDLLLFGKWDGSSRVWGPDSFSVTLRGGPRLLFATFGTCGFWVNNNEQSYPDEYPWAVHRDWTGATEKQVDGLRPAGFQMALSPDKTDSVYQVEMIFPHTADVLTLDFAGIYDDQAGDQAWGVRNLQVDVAGVAPTPTDRLPALWDDLASTDPFKANAALWQFVGAGEAAKKFIAAKAAELQRQINSSDNHDSAGAANGLRLHRAHRIVRIIGGPGSGSICFTLDHLFPEY